MTQQEIQERNKQIALMLGGIKEKNFWNQESYRLEQFERLSWSNVIQDNFENPHFTLSELQFHSDWNWLMEAVEFIEKIYNNQPIYFGHNDCVIFSPKTIKSKGKDKKEAIFIAISDFAKLYNNNKEL